MAFPLNPVDGEQYTADGAVYQFVAADAVWKQITHGSAANASSSVLGTIIQSLLSETQFNNAVGVEETIKWALMDGRNIGGSDYAALKGVTNVPDARGTFIRMAGQNAVYGAWNGGVLGSFSEAQTGRPVVPFTLNSAGNHSHSPYMYDGDQGQCSWDRRIAIQGAEWSGKSKNYQVNNRENFKYIQTSGNHTHTITGGGDSETRPKTFVVNYFIKINI